MSQNWTLIRTSNPNALAVSLVEAKSHLRISGSSQDDHILLLIESATDRLERDTNRCIITASWLQSLDKFPCDGEPILLHMKQVTSVEELSYVDENGDTQVMDPSQYSVNLGRQMIFAEGDGQWAAVKEATKSDKVFVKFTCGVDKEACVPRLYKQAILLEVARAFFDPAQENGVSTNDGRSYEAIVRKLVRSSYP